VQTSQRRQRSLRSVHKTGPSRNRSRSTAARYPGARSSGRRTAQGPAASRCELLGFDVDRRLVAAGQMWQHESICSQLLDCEAAAIGWGMGQQRDLVAMRNLRGLAEQIMGVWMCGFWGRREDVVSGVHTVATVAPRKSGSADGCRQLQTNVCTQKRLGGAWRICDIPYTVQICRHKMSKRGRNTQPVHVRSDIAVEKL
jgi:hypothetical protein